jgi:ribokinase
MTIAFTGRANVDLTLRVPYRPGPGRAVFAPPLVPTPGGKSLNQAYAAARLGGDAALIATAGDDDWGRLLHRTLTGAGVSVDDFRLIPGVPTGAAVIEVTPDGESYVVLAPSADLTAADVERARPAEVVVAQLDLPWEPLEALLARPRPRVLIGNLVPHPDFDLAALDVFVANEHEAAAVLGEPSIPPDEAAAALRGRGIASVVVTAGPRGAAYAGRTSTGTVGAPPVVAVDTTGAGDAFLAALALHLGRGEPLADSVIAAVRVGSRAVTQRGSLLA